MVNPEFYPLGKRRSELELARVVACCCIILIHQVFTYHVDYPVGNFLRMLAKGCATTIFFMITGAFFSARQSFAKQVGRLAVKNVLPFLVVAPLILQFWPALSGQVSLPACLGQWNLSLHGFLRLLFSMNVDTIASPHGYANPSGGIFHLWFMFALYKCYFFLPLLKPLLADGPAGDAVKRYALAGGAVLFLLVPTAKLCVGPDSIFARMPEIQLEPFLWLWVMLVGNHLYYHLGRKPRTGKELRRIGFASAAVYLLAMSGNYLLTMRYALEADGVTANDRFLERGFIPLFLANIAAFVFFATLRIGSEKAGARIRSLARKTFYIYVFHVPVLALLRTTLFANLEYHDAGAKLLVLVCVFGVCYVIASLCRYAEKIIGGAWVRLPLGNLLPRIAAPALVLRQGLGKFVRK